MYPLMNTAPVSDMNRNPNKIIAQLSKGPIALLSRSEPAAIMILPSMWNRLMEQLDDQQDVIDALVAQLEIATGRVETEPADIALLEEMAQRVRA
ncbi:MAG: hypothetical protein R2911_04970 [Caldilineaceae bacterium]